MMSSDHGPRLRALIDSWRDLVTRFYAASREANHDGNVELDAFRHGKASGIGDCIYELDGLLRASASALPRPTAGDLYIRACERWAEHAEHCELGECEDCDALLNQFRLTRKIWKSSAHQQVAASALPLVTPDAVIDCACSQCQPAPSALPPDISTIESWTDADFEAMEQQLTRQISELQQQLYAISRGYAPGKLPDKATRIAASALPTTICGCGDHTSNADGRCDTCAMFVGQACCTETNVKENEDLTRSETRGDSVVSSPPQRPEGL